MNVQEFADLVLAQTQDRLRTDYPASPQWSWEQVAVKPGPVYTKVDIGPKGNMSGKYMIENATGIIYGIKGYGKVHKGHRYGTLETVGDWYWGGYTGVKTAAAEARERGRRPIDADLFTRTAPQWNCVAFPGEGPHYLDGQGGCQWCGQDRGQIASGTAPRAEVDPERLSGWRGFAHQVRYRGQNFVVSTAGDPDGGGGYASLVFRSDAAGKVTSFDDVAGGNGRSREQAITELEARPVDEDGYVLSPRDVLDRQEAAAEAAEGREAIRKWLLGYAWAEDTPEAREAVVECILSQDDWRHIDALADKFAGAQEEPGPAAFSEGTGFALSALYECHDGPHLESCPNYRGCCKECQA